MGVEDDGAVWDFNVRWRMEEGRSVVQASQQRYVGGFERVQIGQVHESLETGGLKGGEGARLVRSTSGLLDGGCGGDCVFVGTVGEDEDVDNEGPVLLWLPVGLF